MDPALDDAELLRRYVDEQSDAAFAELVRRHIDLVYSVAFRQVAGDVHLAQDVAQTVFAALARKSRELRGRATLSGWLYRSTHYAASVVVRAERRRRAREQEVYAMSSFTSDSAEAADWEKVRPVLDAAIAELNDVDRDAVALRFFHGLSFAEIGAKLRLSENAARMRLERAVDMLHASLARRGVTSSVAALGLALAQQAGIAAPAGTAATVTGIALAGAGSAAVATTGAAAIMSMAKLQVGIAGALALAGASGFVLQTRSNAALQNDLAQLAGEHARLSDENARLASMAKEVSELRQDDAELSRLQAEADKLRERLKAVERMDTEMNVVYDITSLTERPDTKSSAPLLYPPELRGTGVGGTVIVGFVVGADGNVKDVTVERSPHPLISAAAVDSLLKWKFEPGRRGDVAVNTRMRLPVVFKPEPVGDSPEKK